VIGWLALSLAMIGWHLPGPYQLALRSTSWHEVEHLCLFTGGLLFWWPVVQPWPTRAHWPAWSLLRISCSATS
jgi:cytochrome c oxidase assembly factor CtaG